VATGDHIVLELSAKSRPIFPNFP